MKVLVKGVVSYDYRADAKAIAIKTRWGEDPISGGIFWVTWRSTWAKGQNRSREVVSRFSQIFDAISFNGNAVDVDRPRIFFESAESFNVCDKRSVRSRIVELVYDAGEIK